VYVRIYIYLYVSTYVYVYLNLYTYIFSDGSSHLWVLRGDTGKTLEGYPMALPKEAIASASVLLIDLHDYTKEAQTKVSIIFAI
jgi:hypothetical protein